jgi:cytochrome oxidase assembly protein ShyY1
MKKIFGLTLLAILLMMLCVRAAQWQYERHVARSSFNALIEANIAKPPLSEDEILTSDKESVAWREIKLSGSFDPKREILVRNRYQNGQYGFGVVTLFISNSGKKYWIDRGWVAAGPNAQTPPKVSKVISEQIAISGRARYENIEKQISGTVFAMPNSDGKLTLQKWNSSEAITTENFYLDLISASDQKFNPQYPTLLPELSAGPHLAYTFQWALFALFVVFGWFLVVREELKARKLLREES